MHYQQQAHLNQPETVNSKRDALLSQLSNAIESFDAMDASYAPERKAADILGVLEVLLAYAIYNTTETIDDARDSADESYVNIKRMAVAYHKKQLAG